VRMAAQRFQCSPVTASSWARRYRAGLPLADRSPRPGASTVLDITSAYTA